MGNAKGGFMSNTVEMSETIRTIHERRDLDFDRAEIPTRDRCFHEIFARRPPDEPKAIQFALGLAHFAEQKKILINEYDLLAGSAFRYSYVTTLPVSSPDDFEPRFSPPMNMEPNREVAETIAFLGFAPDSHEAAELRNFARGVDNWLFKHWESGHIVPGYGRLLRTGYGEIIERCRRALKTADVRQGIFLEAMLICARTFADYVGRYGRLAREIEARTDNPAYRANMRRIAAACDNIALKPAGGFFEAVQLLWFAHEMVLAETFPSSQSLGRLDQYLFPFYQKDLEAGVIDRQEASELIDALWIKFGANLHSFQNVTLGGLDQDGRYQANDLTYMALRSTRRLKYDQPLVSLRYHESLPPELWEEAVLLVREGLGFPAFLNDEQSVKAKLKMGYTPEDAWNYSIVGCVELSVEGREYAKTEVLRVNWLKVMELMLHNGRSSVCADVIPPNTSRDLNDIKSFDDFYNWYKVFDEGWIILPELAEAAYNNFEGREDLLRRIGECPKFGNDDDRVDLMMADLTALFAQTIDGLRNPRGGKFQMGLYSVEDHAKMGLVTGATPDGRLAGRTMANAFSPVQGQDVAGPTAVANSLTKTDMSAAGNGMVLDMKFNPRFFDQPSHREALKALIDTFFERGGMEIQFNAIDRATLIDAQTNPDKHRNLVVRVSGFSAHFTTLIKNTQDDIIARTEYMAS